MLGAIASVALFGAAAPAMGAVTYTSVSAGQQHTVAQGSDGKVYTWGKNDNGQLGDGATVDQATPAAISLAVGVTATAVSAGSTHSAAVGSDGNVYTWGDNGHGQLGDGTISQRLTPVAITLAGGGVTATAVSAGAYFTAAVGSDGKVYTWGYNNRGQLGDGTTNQSLTPVAITLAAGVSATAVSTGYVHTAAVGSDGKVYIWGYNNYGQLGDGTYSQRLTPVAITLAAGVTASAVSAGNNHTVAVGSDGKVYGWGSNSSGQLGNGATGHSVTPVAVTLAGGVTAAAVSAGGDHTLAVGSDHKVYSWGSNISGEVGDGTTTQRLSPVVITLAGGVTGSVVSAGWSHTAAVGSDAKLYTWGKVTDGALGGGFMGVQPSPVAITPAAGVVVNAGDAGAYHTAAKGDDGKVYTWGYNASGQLGDGTTTASDSPLGITLAAGVKAVAASAGEEHTVAAGDDGKVYAWGSNGSGQLGDGTYSQRLTPVAITLAGGVTATAVSAGTTHTAAVGSDGKVYAWGANNTGQLGNGTTTPSLTPVAVTLAAGVTATAVSAGKLHTAAVGSDGKVYTWGYNDNGQLGDGTLTQRLSPVAITLAAGVTATAVSAGTLHTAAVGSDGKVYSWGLNDHGQLGDGTTTRRLTPVAITLAAGVTASAVSAGNLHTVAVGSDGKVYAWGRNFEAQLGDGTTTQRLSPVAITLADGVTASAVGAGFYHTAALGSDGKLYTWGSDGYGQVSGHYSGWPATTIAPFHITNGSVADGAFAAAYSQSLSNSGGTGTASYSLLSGTLPAGLSLAANGTLSGTPTAVGSATFTLYALDGNSVRTTAGYSLTIAKGAQTITFGALADKVHGDAAFSVSATASSGLTVSFASQTTAVCTTGGSNGATVTLVEPGSCTIRASQAGNGDYNAASTVDRSFTVNKESQSIAFGSLSNKTYGDASFTVSASASSGLTPTFSSQTTRVCTASGVNGATIVLVSVGTCTVRATQAGDNRYHAATPVDQSFTVLPPAPITVTGRVEEWQTFTGASVIGSVVNNGLLLDPEIKEGASVSGGRLGGRVTNGGVAANVTLASGTELVGGAVAGSVSGDPEGPATLWDVSVGQGATLSNVTIDGNSIVGGEVRLGEGVRFTDGRLIPPSVDLSGALGSVGGDGAVIPPAVDLSTDVVVGGASIIDEINALPSLVQAGLRATQHPESGTVEMTMGVTRFALLPTHVSQAPAGTPPGGTITKDGLLEIVTLNGRRIVLEPILQSLENFISAVRAVGFTVARGENSQLSVLLPEAAERQEASGEFYFSIRPAIYSDPAEISAEPGVAPCELSELVDGRGYCQTFAQTGELRIQPLWPVPADWGAMETALLESYAISELRMDENGTIHLMLDGVAYSGHADYVVEVASGGTGQAHFNDIVVGDESTLTLGMEYANGERQSIVLMAE